MITLHDIQIAQERLKKVAIRTPLLFCPGYYGDSLLYLKPENLQPTGAFKLRGAYNKLASLSEGEKRRGVVAYSSGNHAQGVAYAAGILGIHSVIVMPASAPQIKIARTVALGAEVVLIDHGGEERWRIEAEHLAAKCNYVMVPPFNDEMVIAGQATIGSEILDDLPGVETVLVPIGGGGLISGVAIALKLRYPNIHVIGVEPELAADAYASFHKGYIVELPLQQTRRTIADGMRAPRLGDITFAYVQKYVDDIVRVSDEEIRQAMQNLILNTRLIAEPSGATTLAAFMFHQQDLPQTKLNVAVISGGNVEPAQLMQILAEMI